MAVRKEVLSNNLTIVTESIDHVRSVAIGIWVKNGSRQEPAEKNGISHFIEHMLFKGTRKRSTEDIAKAIDSIGGQMDAFTTREYVGFYIKVLDDHLATALELLSDIVLNPTFPEDELEKERNVIFEEISMTEDTPQDLVYEIFTEKFWNSHPLGRPISGTKASVQSITRDDLFDYFRRRYTAENMLVSIAGHIRHEQVAELVGRYFGQLEKRGDEWNDHPPVPLPHFIQRSKNELEQIHICLGTVSPSLTSERRYAVSALSNILGGGLSSRLFQNIREKRGLVYTISSGLSLYRDAGCLIVYAGTGTQTAPLVLDLTIEELRKLRDSGVTEEELQRSKDNMKGALVLGLESTSSRMSNIAQQEMYFGRYISLDEMIQKIDSITTLDIKSVADEILDDKYLSLTILGNLDGIKINKGTIGL